MRCACIDIGSNTTRLLVVEPTRHGLATVRQERVFLPLSGIDRGGVARRRAGALIRAVERLAALAASDGVAAGSVQAVATQALRVLPDDQREQLLAQLSAAAGAGVELLSTEREAELAFRGATAGADPRSGPVAVVDVGGGSTEVVVGVPGAVPLWWYSAPLGSRGLTERCLPSDPPTASELGAAAAVATEQLAPATAAPAVERVLTVGGGTQSLARLLDGRPADERLLGDALRMLTTAGSRTIAARHDIDDRRARTLPAALVLLVAAVAPLGRPVEPGAGGVREGLLLERLAREQ